ncbi:globin domain-containing protein [Yinghuangia soli]|uniref:nitric oxide dioxygenase n=1 Tax=Yinghuangia soli TaxID=2908204 RepID=A0AA41Q7L9_9ACTN|nr:globin domain-containing protein [Yinghuangia soli]MCF2532732.1 globin domain-containing protein [Yinghuangia soli]
MLSTESANVVRATLPAVGGAIGEITTLFYAKLFAAHPELQTRLFNRGNQETGAQQQALAGSVAAFASMLVAQPDARPDALLSRIANKHASLGVTEAQYQVVHTHLFAAIVEVLGDAVTAEVAAAWDEVYWLMANALIAIEKRLYDEAGIEAGESWRPWTVVARTEETAEVASFELAPADGAPAPAFKAGQYVSVAVELPDGARQIRQYSLSSAASGATRRISVKRIAGADAAPSGEVSNRLHADVAVGDVLTVGAPFGDLVLDDSDGPLVLASAGIGITPIVGILEHLVAAGSARRVVVVHADRSAETHPLRADLDKLVAQLPEATAHVWYEVPGAGHPEDRVGYADLGALDLPSGAQAYLCGPLPFMKLVRGQLIAAGVPAADVHYEVFGPDLWQGAA